MIHNHFFHIIFTTLILLCAVNNVYCKHKNQNKDQVEDKIRPWPDAEVNYMFSGGIHKMPKKNKEKIKFIMSRIEQISCIRFKEIPKTIKPRILKRTLEIVNSKKIHSVPCSATYGFKKYSKLIVNMKKCGEGDILHELLHVLGLPHEHLRPDRDEYVTIIESNIIPGAEKEFEIRNDDKMLTFPYDYYSIMHANLYEMTKDKEEMTIVPKDKEALNNIIGQRVTITALDSAKLNKLYECNINYKNLNE